MKVQSRHHLRKLRTLYAEGQISREQLAEAVEGVDIVSLPDRKGETDGE